MYSWVADECRFIQENTRVPSLFTIKCISVGADRESGSRESLLPGAFLAREGCQAGVQSRLAATFAIFAVFAFEKRWKRHARQAASNHSIFASLTRPIILSI